MSSKPLIIGHRGASAIAPENTLSAFRLALEAGADGVEFDVRLTRDGVPVVIHDDNLRRTGSSSQRIADLSLAELKEVDVGSWFDSSFAREKIPTLEHVFELFAHTNALLYLEMKSNSAERNRLAKICCDSLRSSSLRDRVIVECFDLAGIAAVKEIDPEIKTAALFEPGLATPPFLASSRKIVDQALAVAADEIALHHRLATDRVVETAKQAGLTVVVWTVDDPAWIKRAASVGIAALITNDPGRMIRQRDSGRDD